MTIAKVLLAIAMLVLGFMLLGVQRNMLHVGDRIDAGFTALGGQITTAQTKLDTVITRQKGMARISRPRTKPVPHLQHIRPPPPPIPLDWFRGS